MLNNLINNFNNSSDIKPLAMSRQIDMLNNDISGPEDSVSGLKKDRNLSND